LEYTDAPISEIAPNETPSQAAAARPSPAAEHAEGAASDLVAMLLSVIPGLGHIYKGHKVIGLLLILGAPLAVALSALAATATAGFGLGLMALYWFAAGFHAYAISDRVTPGIQDEGEQY